MNISRAWAFKPRRVLPEAPFQGKELRTPAFVSSEFRGYVDGIVHDEIRGWVLDESEPGRYIKLCLILDGKLIEKTTACIFRKDLQELFHSNGLHGFSFRIPDAYWNRPQLTFEIRLEDGRLLCPPTSIPNTCSRVPGMSEARRPCLVMIHIPKTAVTAIRAALRSDWLTDRHIWLYGDPPGFPIEHILYLTESQLNRVEFIVGHFPFGLHTFLPQSATYATVLREPVARCVSHYFQDRFKSQAECNPAREMSLDELVQSSCPGIAYDNLMVRMLTGMGPVPFGGVDRKLLEEAIGNIHSSFSYVGLQSRTAEAVNSLSGYLNIQPNALQLDNVGLYNKDAGASATAIKRLRELNQFDAELCKYVEAKFWSSGLNGWTAAGQASRAAKA